MDDEDSKGGRVVMAVTRMTKFSGDIVLLLQPGDLNVDEYHRVGVAWIVEGRAWRPQGTTGWERRTIKIV